ncbi:TlpA family protein disulfide reductase [Acidiphilium sp. PA]|uniref:TlpA family protein disulfide reductase n=1 Tax=Acidiphilium sp. PA TaxID=2871705 RepID=UPI0022439C16|nr:TlpA disulfide reductase family protein [Acidiphilium sp. PA]MCW8309072.1 TlpA family protein disulfide reductase [Acidiphilium sp. PA]
MTLSPSSRRGFLTLAASGAALGLPRSAAAAIPNAPPLYITTPKPLQTFKFSDASGHPLSLADFHGKFVLLNIWATWCVPCRKEMPTLDRLQAKLGGPHFEVVPVSIDTGGLAAVKKFYAEIKVEHLGIFLDPSGSAMQLLNLEGVPTSFLINPDGKQIGRETGGAVWDTPSVIRFLKHQVCGRT